MQKDIKTSLIYGFAIFAMFFGSGNLVFPLYIGYQSKSSWLYGFFGFMISSILLPFCGLFVIKLYNGDYNKFFAQTGRKFGFFLPMLLLSLLGSFGIVPRCISLSYAGFVHFIPGLNLPLFSAAFCLLMFLICLKDKFMMTMLAKWLSPILLILILFITASGIINNHNTSLTTVDGSFAIGFFTGYQTMDLLASFFFSALIFQQIQNNLPENQSTKTLFLAALKPSIIGCMLIASVYMGFVYLGATYSNLLDGIAREKMLIIISQNLLGNNAAWIVAVIIFFSCITTAIALNNIYAKYILTTAQKLNLGYINLKLSLVATTLISFVMSLLNFASIIAFLEPLLSIIYPALISLTISSIIFYKKENINFLFFWFTVIYLLFLP